MEKGWAIPSPSFGAVHPPGLIVTYDKTEGVGSFLGSGAFFVEERGSGFFESVLRFHQYAVVFMLVYNGGLSFCQNAKIADLTRLR